MSRWGIACGPACGWCGACTDKEESDMYVRRHLDAEEGAEEVHHTDDQGRTEFVGCIKANADGTWQIDSCRDWHNLTSPNQPSREAAIHELVQHAKYRNRIDALHAEKVNS